MVQKVISGLPLEVENPSIYRVQGWTVSIVYFHNCGIENGWYACWCDQLTHIQPFVSLEQAAHAVANLMVRIGILDNG
jgi:hypothetical protein